MRVVLDVDACVGHGRCYALASEVFEPDDDGHCVVLVAGELPVELHGAARLAVNNCPERALAIEDTAKP